MTIRKPSFLGIDRIKSQSSHHVFRRANATMVAMSEASTFPATMNQPLQDRVILITGASGGLGNILATA
ncbi:MAG: hypothetical protein ACPGZP_07795, partial [Panacagrimonas sp.]